MKTTLDGQRLAREARRRYPRSIGFQGAFLDGARARASGRPLEGCPYARRRTQGVVARGWSPVWRSVWTRGWLLADRLLG